MNALVIGAAGLMGRYLCSALVADGHRVTALVRVADARTALLSTMGVSVVVGDLASGFLVPPGQAFDTVVYLAQSNRSKEFPSGATDVVAVNVSGVAAAAQWAVENGVTTFVSASTGSVYQPSPHPHAETDPCFLGEGGLYAASKIAGEAVIGPFASLMRVIVLRPFFVYGLGQKDSMLFASLIRSVRTGNPITLRGAPGGLLLQPTHAADAAQMIVGLLSRADGSLTVNVAGESTVSLGEVVTLIGNIIGTEPTLINQPGPLEAVLADRTLLCRYAPPCVVSLSQGLTELVERAEDPTP